MPKEALIILIPIAIFALFKMLKHERAAGAHIGNHFTGTQAVMKYGMIGAIVLVFFIAIGAAFFSPP